MPVDVHPLDAVRSWTVPTTRPLSFRRPAEIMGILNLTPDSFSDGGLHLHPEAAAAGGTAMLEAGAAWIDLGGESTRPGSSQVSLATELERVLPALELLRARHPLARISIDTTKPEVARQALLLGADMINDISAAAAPGMLEVVAEAGCPLVLMHMQGTPASMQRSPQYRDLVGEVEGFFAERLRACERHGIPAGRLVLDPGIGFGKTLAHNLQLLRSLPRFERTFDLPLLVGVSRKSFIARITGASSDQPPASRDQASHVLHALLARSCALLRVHDVPGAVIACRLSAATAGDWHPHV